MSLLSPLAPYLTLIKWGAALLILSVVFWGGCKVQKGRDAGKLDRAGLALVTCSADRNSMADALNAVNANAAQAQRDAADQAKNATAALKQADKDRAAYESRLRGVDAALDRAKRAPACRAQLEAPLCVGLE